MSEFDHGTHAARNRWEKAQKMAAFAWDAGLTPDHVAAMDDTQLGRLAHLAGVNPPRRGSTDTRALLLAFLVRRTYRAEGWPDEPGNRRRVVTEAEAAARVAHRRGRAG